VSKKSQAIRVAEVGTEDMDLFGFGEELPTTDFSLIELPLVANNSSITPVVFGSHQLLRVPVALIRDNPYQYRQEITPASVEDLVEQFRERGIENALEQFPKATTREEGGETVYVLINGHRRRTAWGIAFPNEAMPLAVKSDISDRDLIFGGLVENLSRVNVSEVEAARGMQALLDTDPKMTQQKLAQLFKRNKSNISRMLQLLTLPLTLQEENRVGRLSLRTGVTLARFASIPGAAEHAYQQLTNAGLTAEEVEKRGWELLRGWSGWELQTIPPEAAEILLPKITTYSAVTPPSNGYLVASQPQAQIYPLHADGEQYQLGNLAYQSNQPAWAAQPETPPARPMFTIVPPIAQEVVEFEVAQPTRADLLEMSPYEVADVKEVIPPARPVFTLEPTPEFTEAAQVAARPVPETTSPYEIEVEKPNFQPFPPIRKANYEAVEEFLWKLKHPAKVGQEAADQTLRLAVALLVGMGIATGETEVVKKIVSHRWKRLGGETPYPIHSHIANAWQWTQKLSLETLALLAGELVVEQWRWEQDNFPKLEDTQTLGWLEEFLKTLP